MQKLKFMSPVAFVITTSPVYLLQKSNRTQVTIKESFTLGEKLKHYYAFVT